jgi:hypothetical protein
VCERELQTAQHLSSRNAEFRGSFRTDEAPGSPTGEFVSGTAVLPYEFGTDGTNKTIPNIRKFPCHRRWSLTLGVGASVVGTRAPLVM